MSSFLCENRVKKKVAHQSGLLNLQNRKENLVFVGCTTTFPFNHTHFSPEAIMIMSKNMIKKITDHPFGLLYGG